MRDMSSGAITIRNRDATRRARVARLVVTVLGGRYSSRLGIDVDAGEAEVERWFLAATLFGTRISAGVAERTFGVLDRAGLRRVTQARHIPWDDLVALLDAGGYARYDFRTATRLQDLAEMIGERYGGQVSVIGRSFTRYPQLHQALDMLPGWGPVTIQLFLRELRGVWPGAQPPLDQRAAAAARHLGLAATGSANVDVAALTRLAGQSDVDLRDLEGGLVRLALTPQHRGCPGGPSCTLLVAGRR
jgi:endonuclease III